VLLERVRTGSEDREPGFSIKPWRSQNGKSGVPSPSMRRGASPDPSRRPRRPERSRLLAARADSGRTDTDPPSRDLGSRQGPGRLRVRYLKPKKASEPIELLPRVIIDDDLPPFGTPRPDGHGRPEPVMQGLLELEQMRRPGFRAVGRILSDSRATRRR